MSDNLKIWDALKSPPAKALSKINGGRLNGMTDIKPQWRYKAMTEQFGPVGIGWTYTIVKEWIEQGADGNVCAFVNIELVYMVDGKISLPIPGTGGASFVAKERSGLHTSDECFKMATTDALSVAMKMIGVGAEVYEGNLTHESKYSQPEQKPAPKQQQQTNTVTADIARELKDELLAMSMGNEVEAADRLKEFTTFQGKDKADVWMKWDQVEACSENWLKSTLAKVKKAGA